MTRRIVIGGFAALCLAVLAAAGLWVKSLGPAPLGQDLEYSTIVVDREGRLLRPYLIADGRWRMKATVEDVDPRFIKLLLAYEDRRFYEHAGVDVLAVLRAGWQFVAYGRIVSGASTLTMQVARLLEPRERTIPAKLRQMVRAWQLEWALNKKEILSLYLSLAPYGGNIEGIRAASLAYFGKEPRRLSLAEAALLVALPQSPEARRPDRAPEAARQARDRVLDRAAAQFVPADEIAAAKRKDVPDSRQPMPAFAPHAADQAIADAPDRKVHKLTIEAPLQRTLEDLARERARTFGPKISVAIVAIDNASGEIRARVASSDYFDAPRAGQVDMTRAVRSPGSTLKPFIYGLGFEDGLVHPETLIDDRPAQFGRYAPENFDLTFQGTVPVRRALQISLNVPAVLLLDKIGANRLAARLAQAGGALTLPEGEVPGLAMGLGGLGVTLADLTKLYAGLARLGSTVDLIERQERLAAARPPRRLLDPAAAWYVGNVLLGTPPPENATSRRIAFKTGTSYGYRDAWSVGFDGRRTIGVWVGRADGAPVPGQTGRSAAAPILFDAFARTGRAPEPLPPAPKGVIFASASRLPPTLQRFQPEAFAGQNPDAPKILYPPNGARVETVHQNGRAEPLALKVGGGAEPLTVMVNGMPVDVQRGRRVVFYDPRGPGFVRVTVIDANGLTDSVVVRVQ